jgi:hypothetical protein
MSEHWTPELEALNNRILEASVIEHTDQNDADMMHGLWTEIFGEDDHGKIEYSDLRMGQFYRAVLNKKGVEIR